MNLYKADAIKAGVKISQYLTDQGVRVHGNRTVATWRQGERDSVSIDDEQGVWNDHVANEGGTVLDLCMKIEGLDFLGALRTLGDRYHVTPYKVSRKPTPTGGRRDALIRDGHQLVKTYTYTDEAGTPRYYVDRYEKYDANGDRINKEFVQRTDEAENIQGVTRLLYNLPNVINADDVILVEGERDADTLNALGLVATTNSGGVTFWTADLAVWLKGKHVAIIADNDDAGQAGAHKRAVSLAHVAASVKVITVSALPKGDVTDWLDREGGTADKLREIVANTEIFHAATFERFGHKVDGDSVDGFDTYGREIDEIDGCGSHFVTVNAGRESIRAAVSRNAAEITSRIVKTRKASQTEGGINVPASKLHEIENVVTVMWLRSRGRLFWNAQTKQHNDSLFFDNKLGQLFAIESDEFQSKIANMTDISRSGQQYRTLHALINDAAICPEVAAGVIPSKYYDRKGDALYISNGDSYMVRVTATEISTVKNGTDDVVFLTGATLPPWELHDGNGIDPFDNALIFTDAWYLTQSGKMLLRLWYLSVFAKHRKRPPLLITAPFGCGKTALFDGINNLLANRQEANADISDTPRGKLDFWTAMHAGGLYCIDNADTRVSWLSDTLQKISTGTALPKLKLYKDDVLVCLYPNADIVVTSNNPQFADDCGLSDRFIIVRLEKRGERIAKDGALKDDLMRMRDAALTWTARTLQRALATPPDAEAGGRINGRHPDFATFALRCAEAIGRRPEAEAALLQAELDKTLIVLQNAKVARDVFAFLRSVNGKWSGKASELAKAIWPELDDDDATRRSAGTDVGKALREYAEQFHVCFTFDVARPKGVTVYHFTGIDKRLDTSSTLL